MNTSSSTSKYVLSRSNYQTIRIVLITSLVWVLIDAFLIIYITDCDCSNVPCKEKQLLADLLKHNEELAKREKPVEPGRKDLVVSPDRYKYKQSISTSYQFSSKNPRHGFLNKLKIWFKEKPVEATNPPNWPGENGKGVVIPPKLKPEAEKRFKENQFNIVASDLIALNRSVPDQRSQSCKDREYPVELPTTSIIIVHHNEGNSTLLRGLTSIIRKSPLQYIKEIILVDDCSTGRDYLLKPLDDFCEKLPVKVKVLRNEKRLGLMRSRLVGAAAATGDTMTFLDAHIECTDGWLPPLLTELKHNRRSIVSPIIDAISDEDFAYLTGSITNWGGFNGRMEFRWYDIPKRERERNAYDFSLPSRTPTMAGGLFTIDREYFYELGSYDEGMDIWGAENLEMSFRAWMCGGTLLIVPCSHVGHVFRKQTPYTFPGGTNNVIFRNNRRLVDVWTDEYKEYFHKVVPELNTIEAGDVSPRLELKKKLKCNTFKWYLTNIYPEAPIPHDFYHVGEIHNVGLNFCIDTMGHKAGEDAGSSYCHGNGGNQVFEYSKQHQIATSNLCLDSNGALGAVSLRYCVPGVRSQQWDYDNQHQLFRNRQTAACLAIHERDNNALTSITCNNDDQLQKWTLRNNLFPEEPNLDISSK